MKTTLLATLLCLSMSSAFSQNPCETQQAQITKRLEKAKKNGHQSRISGLEKALKESKENCTPEKLAQKKKNHIAKLEAKIKDYQNELKEVQGSNQPKQMKKIERKLKRAQQKLKELKAS